MTLTQILADVYRRTGFASSPASDVSTRITAFINETQQELLELPGMETLLNDTTSFASVASQQQYGLTQAVARVKRIWEITNDRILTPLSADLYRALYPDPAAVTGTPIWWVDLGLDAASVEPSDSSQLLVDSDAAGDTNTAYLEGFRSNGTPFTASVTMTGTTAVNLGPSNVIQVTKFYLSTAAVGTVTLVEDAEGGTTLATIGIAQTHARVRKIALAPTPSAAVTYSVEFERHVTDMSNGTDEPVLPLRFHRLLATGARMKEYEKQAQLDRYTVARGEYEQGVRQLKYWLHSQAVGSPSLRPLTLPNVARQRLTAW